MTRILFVGPKMAIGGTERHLQQLLPELARFGFSVHLQVLERGGELEADLLQSGIEVDGPPPGLNRARRALSMIIGLVQRIKKLKPDVIHCFLPEPTMLGIVAAQLAGHRDLIVSRRSLAAYRRSNPWLGRLELLLNRFAKAYLGNSQAVVAEIVEENGQVDRVGLIYNGIALPASPTQGARCSLRREVGLAADAFVILTVANLIPYKGHGDLLSALYGARDALPSNWQAIFIGNDQGYGRELKDLGRSLGLYERCHFLGGRINAIDLMAGADVFVLPSHQEGFSNALIEAMALGLPVVATAVGGSLDAIEDARSGLLVPPHAPSSLGEAILFIAQHEAEKAQIGETARERVHRDFSLDTMVTRYGRLYRNIGEIGRRPLSLILDGQVEP